MSKVIALMNKPKNCLECVFGVCKYSNPATSMKGYYCQLKEPQDRVTEMYDFLMKKCI